jgi:hypothetical protein
MSPDIFREVADMAGRVPLASGTEARLKTVTGRKLVVE